MTENKPIIDGVDVSGCPYAEPAYKTPKCRINYFIHCDGHNCHYKKWQRKEKECKDLKKKLKAKTQECEELKERLNSRCFDHKSNNNRCISYNRIAEDYERDLKQLDQLKATKHQAEQKINKIKDKCNETLELMDKDSGTNAYAGGRCTEAVQILQIIDEVE